MAEHLRFKGRGKDLVTGKSFLRGRAAEAVAEMAFALFKVGGPHLRDDVAEAGLVEEAVVDRDVEAAAGGG